MAETRGLQALLDRIAAGTATDADRVSLHQMLQAGERRDVVQVGKYNVHIGQGQDIQIGDRVYQGADATTIRQVFLEVLDQAAAYRDRPPAPGESPYKGLRYFDEADADLFFGREWLTARLAGHLRQHRLLVVVGASGSGKSSVVRAGLIPALRRGAPLIDGTLPPEGSSSWNIQVITPTERPLDRPLPTPQPPSPAPLGEGRGVLAAGERGERSGLLVVDQFEELFTLCRDEAARHEFVDRLLSLVEGDSPVHLVIILRADFYSHCSQFARLREALTNVQIYIGPMSQDELRSAIEEPARRGGWELEPGLTDLLLRDVGDEPGALPLLAHALLETWKQRRGHTMTLQGYREAGGVRGAIARTADRVYGQLHPEQQGIARGIFLQLTELGEGAPDTRRRVSLARLAPTPEKRPTVESVLQTLAAARLVTTEQETAEVAHEALIREWPRLRGWLDEVREGLRLHRQLAEDAQEWAALRRDPGALYRGARLAQAREWAAKRAAEMSDLETEFLRAGRRAQQRRLVGVVLGTLLVVLALAAAAIVFSVQSRQNATLAQSNADIAATAQANADARGTAEAIAVEQRDEAQRQARVARARQLAAQAQEAFWQSPPRGLLLAVEALSVTLRAAEPRLASAESVLRDELAESGGIPLRGHKDAIHALAFSPDGHYLATGGMDGTALLWEMANLAAKPRVLHEQEAGIYALAFSPDGHYLATGDVDGTALLWEMANLTAEPRVLTGHTAAISALAFSPDSRYLATASEDYTAQLWDLANPTDEAAVLSGHKQAILVLAFSPDGRYLATGSNDGTARLWNVADPTAGPRVLAGHTDVIFALAFSPDRRYLATGSWDGTVRLWETADPTAGPRVLDVPGGGIITLAFSPEGRYLATGSFDGMVRLWEMANPTAAPRVLDVPGGEIATLAFSLDGRYLAMGSYDGTARLWDVADPTAAPAVLRGHENAIFRLVFSPDGHYLATGSLDNTARLWEVSRLTAEPLVLRRDGVSALALSPDGRYLATGSDDGTVRLWEAADPTDEVAVLPGHSEVSVLAFSLDGRYLAAGSYDGTVQLWEVADPTAAPTVLSRTETPIYTLAFSPDGRYLATGSMDRAARLWEIANPTAEPRVLLGHTREVFTLAFSPNGRYLATGSMDRTVRLWEMADLTAEPRVLLGHEATIYALAFSPDGRYLATGSQDETVRLWEMADLTAEPRVLRGHGDMIRALAFSPDGRHLATGGMDGTARLWEMADLTAEPVILRVSEAEVGVFALAFSPDGHYLATASFDTVRLWDTRLAELVALACRTAGRNLTRAEWEQYIPWESYRKTCPQWPLEGEDPGP